MKKLLTLVFVFATVLVSTNVLTSCKDYDEDYKNDLGRVIDTEHTSIWSAIRTNYSLLRQTADSIVLLQQNCSIRCKAMRDTLHWRVDSLILKDAELQAAIDSKADTAVVNALTDSVNALKSDVNTLTGRVASLEAQDTVFANQIAAINDSITTINQQLAGLTGRVAQNEEDIDSIFKILANLPTGGNGELNLDTLTKYLANTFNITNTTINDIKGDLRQMVNDTLADYYTKSEIDTLLKVISDSLITIDSKILGVKNTADDALRLARLDSIWIEALKDNTRKSDSIINARVDSLADVVKNLNIPTIPEIPDPYDDKLVRDSIQINSKAIEKVREDLNKYIEKNNARVDSLAEVTSNLAELIEQAEQNRKDADELLQRQINALVLALADLKDKDDAQDSKINSLEDLINTSVADIQRAYQAADKELANDIAELERKVNKNAEDIAALDEKIDGVKEELAGRIDKVDEALKKLITGIIPQAVVNPVYGTFAAPVGISSKVLIAFYGETSQPVVFPTDATGNYVKNSQTFTEKDWEIIKATLKEKYTKPGKSTLLSDEEDNAGTLYLTVNPGEVDFTNQQLTIVNSKDEESKVTLNPLKKENDYLIKFGYTRAANDNGFYSAKAHLNEADIDAVKVNIDTEMKSTFKELLRKRTMSKVGELALNIYDQFNGILPAQAVKAEWTIQDSKGQDIKRSFRSEYGLAATAIKPLSYRFLEDLNVQTVPGYEQAISLLNRATNEIKDVVNISIGGKLVNDIEHLNIKKIELSELSDDLKAKFVFHMDTTVTISGLNYHLNLHEPVHIVFTQNASVDLSGVVANVTVPTMVVNVSGSGSPVSPIYVPIKDSDGNVVTVKDVNGEETTLSATINPEQISVKINGSGSTPPTSTTATIAKGTTVVATVPVDQTVYVDIDKLIKLDDYSFRFTKTVDMKDAIDDLWGEVGNQLDNVNDMLDQFKKIVDDVNDLLDDQDGFIAKIDTKVDNAKTRIQGYIDRINDRLCSVINTANRRIQPVLLLTGNNTGTKRISRVKNQPTVLKDAHITFVPTSYTADIVAPAFKKHVAVVDVINGSNSAQGGDTQCRMVLNQINAQADINKVLPGSKNAVDVTFKPGYTYVIAYSALDYHGNISMHKYYVRY